MSWKDEFRKQQCCCGEEYLTEECDEECYVRNTIDFIEALLEEQNAKNLIEITARCKETTEALIKETEQRVLEDCITTLLGCDGKCKECDANIPEVYCPYCERLEQLREKYKGVE
jgi:hypothetical protein